MTTNEYPASITIVSELNARHCDDLFMQLCQVAARDDNARVCGLSADKIFELVKAREALASTAIGNGLILPHIRLNDLECLVVVFGRLDQPMNHPTPDDQPLAIACLLLVPNSKPVEGLRFMADLGSCMRSEEKHNRLLAAQTGLELKELLATQRSTTHTLIAADIMAPPRLFVTPETQLRQATRMMAENRQEILPVLDDGKLVGELSSTELFKLGIPDFFNQLKSVGFIRYFDPFEKYFAVEAASCVGDVMNRELPTFHENATLIEIVFGISVLKQQMIYITNHRQELLGIISQALLLERIINL